MKEVFFTTENEKIVAATFLDGNLEVGHMKQTKLLAFNSLIRKLKLIGAKGTFYYYNGAEQISEIL